MMKARKVGVGVILLYLHCSAAWCYASNEPLTVKLETMLNRVVAHSTTPGAVLLISTPKLGTITVAAGYADKKNHIAMQVNNNFRIGSISKTFVAVTVLKLVERGQLSLEQKISLLVPKFINLKRVPNGDKVTVQNLLQMRSGISDYIYDSVYKKIVESDHRHPWQPKEVVALIYNDKPDFPPNAAYEYSNTNYDLLQLIVEQLTGTTLAKQIRQAILIPFALTHTFYEVQEQEPGGFNGLTTRGYRRVNDKIIDVTSWNRGFGLGDEGMISTVDDLAIFIKALLESKNLLTERSLNQMLQTKGEQYYGMGIYKEKFGDEWAYANSGLSSGFFGQFYYFPRKKITVVVLTNYFDTTIITNVVDKALQIVGEGY